MPAYRSSAIVVIFVVVNCGGCAVTQNIVELVRDHREYHRYKMAATTESHRAKLQAKLACKEARLESAQHATVDSLETNLNVGIGQRIEVRGVEVDQAKLKELMAKREKDYAELAKLWEELEQEYQRAQTEADAEALRGRIDALAHYGVQKGCCQKPHGFGCFCKHLPGQPPLPALPAQRPVSPVEIPMVMRVQWEMGVGPGRLEEARVRQLPALQAQPAKQAPSKAPIQKSGYHTGPRQNTYHEDANPHLPEDSPSIHDDEEFIQQPEYEVLPEPHIRETSTSTRRGALSRLPNTEHIAETPQRDQAIGAFLAGLFVRDRD